MAEGDVLQIVDGHQAFAAPTGGGSIAATDSQIVFMDGTDAVGSEHLTWRNDEAAPATLGLDASENGNATVTGLGPGTQLSIVAADGDDEHVGGELTLRAGSSDGQSGGQLNIQAGNDGGGGDGGPISIYSGSAADGTSGDIDIKVGGTGPSATGGNLNISAGAGADGSGGDVLIQAGQKAAGGSHGSLTLYDGSRDNSIEMNAAGIFIFALTINFDSLPSTDPEVAGQLYTDGVPSAGNPKALMVSGG